MYSFILRLLAIVVCGGTGGLLAWWLVFSLGWTGVGGAIAAAFLGMIVATLLWAGGIALVKRPSEDALMPRLALSSGEMTALAVRYVYDSTYAAAKQR